MTDTQLFKPQGISAFKVDLVRNLIGSEVSDAMGELDRVSGFSLSEEAIRPFIGFRRWINRPPKFIEAWRSNEDDEKFKYLRLMNGLESSQRSFEASAYHLANISAYQELVRETLGAKDFSSLPPNTVFAGGGTERIDFEYQAFVMAARRSLDHFAWGLSTYFGVEQDSFNRFAKQIGEKYRPSQVARSVARSCQNHIKNFEYMIGTERGRSLRDRMAHKEAVQSGAINISKNGFTFVGGGERLGLNQASAPEQLTSVLEKRMHDLRDFFVNTLESFQTGVDQFEAT